VCILVPLLLAADPPVALIEILEVAVLLVVLALVIILQHLVVPEGLRDTRDSQLGLMWESHRLEC
jgi:hypothetical protein